MDYTLYYWNFYLVVITAILCDTVFNVEEKIEVFSVQIAQGLFAGDS